MNIYIFLFLKKNIFKNININNIKNISKDNKIGGDNVIAASEEYEDMPIVQMSIRIDSEIRDQLKITAIKKGIKINDLLVSYLEKGLKKEEK